MGLKLSLTTMLFHYQNAMLSIYYNRAIFFLMIVNGSIDSE